MLPWQHFLERVLWKDRALQNSNDITATSFLDQSQHNFIILLEIVSCTFCTTLEQNRIFQVFMATHF